MDTFAYECLPAISVWPRQPIEVCYPWSGLIRSEPPIEICYAMDSLKAPAGLDCVQKLYERPLALSQDEKIDGVVLSHYGHGRRVVTSQDDTGLRLATLDVTRQL